MREREREREEHKKYDKICIHRSSVSYDMKASLFSFL